MSYNGAYGLNTLASVPRRRVFLFGRGADLQGTLVFADLMDEMHYKSKGKIPIDMIIACPRCGVELNVDGTKKTIRSHLLEKHQRWLGPDGLYYNQEALVTVEEDLMCCNPMQCGKGMCGLKFRITENWIHKV